MIKDTQGYNTDAEYTYNFYDGWTESKIKLTALRAGIKPPDIKNACELGFGQGLTLSMLAAASDTLWYGTDFNKKHADFAKGIAKETANNAKIFDMPFEEFCKRRKLPKFDLIVLHGVISWVSKDNQKIIFEFIKNYLNDNGVVYISYNAKPGMDAFKPARHLLNEIYKILPKEFDTAEKKVKVTLAWLERFHKMDPAYLQAYPTIQKRLQELHEEDVSYIIHEYFNDDWDNFYFSQIAKRFLGSDITYLGKSGYIEDGSNTILSSEQKDFLNTLPFELKEDTKDSILNTTFRKDFWIKNPEKCTQKSITTFLDKQKVILQVPSHDINFNATISTKTIKVDKKLYSPIIKALSGYQAKSISELKNLYPQNSINILDMITTLNTLGIVALVKDDEQIKKNLESMSAYNNMVFESLSKKMKINFLLSATTGSQIQTNNFTALLICSAYAKGNTTQDKILSYVSDYYVSNGLSISLVDKVQTTKKQIAQALHVSIKEFIKKLLPFFKAHRVL